jgi:uncharacterized protein YutE (UPF0331/DUF86 family)
MATSIANLEREKLLKIAEDYRGKGYEVSFMPNPEDLPDFLRSYRPDMVARRGDEAVVVEVKSGSYLSSSSNQYLHHLAQVVEQHLGWRFELVIINSEEAIYRNENSLQAGGSLQKQEIESRLQVARQLAAEYPEAAILYSWSLVEATLRLVVEAEGLSLPRFDPLYLVKKLVTEGVISKAEYQLLMNALSWRNAIAHGFKTKQVTQDSVDELIRLTEHLLKSLHDSI